MIGLVLKSAKTFKALQLVRIQCPVNYQKIADKDNNFDDESGIIFKVTQEDVTLRQVLKNLQALNTGEHPFVAWPMGPALIQFVCPKAVVAKLFKALFAQQRTLGIRLTDLKSHVIISPMDSEELLQACSIDILSSLEESFGWHPIHSPSPDQFGTLLLGVNPMANADGKPQTTPLLDMKIDVSGTDTIVLLLKPSTVRFRHSAVAAFLNATTTTTTTTASLAEASKAAEGSLCRVLPTLTPSIIQKLRIASNEEAQKIKTEWQRAGFSTLPSSSLSSSENDDNTISAGAAVATWQHVVDVRFEEDEDAPTTPFPACAVLSYLGFDPVDTKLNSPGVVGALHRLQENLNSAVYKLFGGGLHIQEMRRWNDTMSLNKIGKASFPVSKGFQSAADMDAAAPAAPARGPSALEKLGEVIDLTNLGSNTSGETTTGVIIKKPHARAGPELLAYLTRLEKEAAAEAAAVAMLHPQQKKTALPPTMALAAQASRAAPVKKTPLLGAKRGLPTAAAEKGATKAPKKAAAAATAGSSKSAAAPKAPKPAMEIDVASLNIPELATAGKLATLTIPQLKAYCRSIKQPVGGKKSDLETRIKAHLGINTEH